jgi:hypothetical protein
MHMTSNPQYPAYPLITWLGDGGTGTACGDLIGERRSAAGALRRAETRCLMAALARRLRLLRSTLKWRLRVLAARATSVAGRRS